MKALMRNGRDRRSANPFVGHARKERVLLIGTDQRITSGPAARTAAFRGRIHDCTRIVSRKGRSLSLATRAPSIHGRVGMWRGGCRLNISVTASFVWRCLSGSTLTPFPHSAHRTGQADLPHPALGQNFTPSPTTGRAQAGTGVRARSARKGARVDKLE